MRIPKAIRVHSPTSYVDRWISQEMRKRGLRELGRGSFGVVYSTGRTARRVVKTINMRRNEAYVDYLKKIVLPLQGKSTLVPKVYKIERFDVEHKCCYLTDETITDHVMFITMERLRGYGILGREGTRRALRKDVRLTDMCELEDVLVGYNKTVLDVCATKLKTFVTKLRPLIDKHVEDIHSGNLMWRKARTKRPEIVIIDPIC